MKKPVVESFDLRRIKVASPCPVSWETMHGDDRSRSCQQCDLTVYNIAGMTADEATELILSRDGRMCIRLHNRADGTVITRDCPKGMQAVRRRATMFAGSVFATILGLFSVNYGQRDPHHDSQGVRSETSIEVASVEGIVKDATGSIIPNAKVAITTASGKILSRNTDRKGRFRLSGFSMEKGRNRIRIEATGFMMFVDEFSIRRRELISYPVTLDAGAWVGVVVVSPEPQIDLRKSSISTTIRVGDN